MQNQEKQDPLILQPINKTQSSTIIIAHIIIKAIITNHQTNLKIKNKH